MILPKTNQKSYGVIHTENYFSFTGFCKKVNSDEIQTVDIYLDDVLIDTILADKKLQKIEDIYDIEGFGFTYNLSNEFIGNKKSISFKNHQTKENLQNSPYELLDTAHPKFNEAKFTYSFNQPSTEEIKNLYKPNSIGFLVMEDNLRDEEFVKCINQIMSDFSSYDFKALYFDKNFIKEIKEKFKADNLDLLELTSIKDVFENIEIFLSNNGKTNIIIEHKLYNYLFNNSSEILPIGLSLNMNSKTTIKQYSKIVDDYYKDFFQNMEFFEFSKKDIEEYGNSFIEIFYKKAIKKYNINVVLNTNDSIREFIKIFLNISLKNHDFLKDLIEFRKSWNILTRK